MNRVFSLLMVLSIAALAGTLVFAVVDTVQMGLALRG